MDGEMSLGINCRLLNEASSVFDFSVYLFVFVFFFCFFVSFCLCLWDFFFFPFLCFSHFHLDSKYPKTNKQKKFHDDVVRKLNRN